MYTQVHKQTNDHENTLKLFSIFIVVNFQLILFITF